MTTSNNLKKPWPTKAAMEQVYERNLWGGEKGAFHSGFGSHDLHLIAPYIDVVKKFLTSFKEPITICDLGCGDFNIGKELVQFSKKYIAVDIAENLIHRNKETYKHDNLEFKCLDISKDELPGVEVAILRHVLQHLGNDEVQRILKKLNQFRYVIITEHIPEGEFTPNKDIISGQGTRLKKQSGLDLFRAPFCFNPREKKRLLSISDNYGRIETILCKLF